MLTFHDTAKSNPIDRLVHEAVKKVSSFEFANSRRKFWIPIIQKLVLTLSDQQLLTGIAVLVAAFWTHCSISVYHFALVNDLAWFSATVHVITLGVLPAYFHSPERHVQRNWRVALMIVTACLLIASTVMSGHREWYDGWPYDAQCLFDDLIGNIGGAPRYWMSVNLALILIDYPLSIVLLFERPTRFLVKWLMTKPVEARDNAIDVLKSKKSSMTSTKFIEGGMSRFACLLLIAMVRGVGWVYFALIALITSQVSNLLLDTFWFAYSLWSIIEDRMIPSSDIDGDENAMTFGQIVPILPLSSLVLVLREAYDGMLYLTQNQPSRLYLINLFPNQIRETEEGRHSSLSGSSQISLVRTRSSATRANLPVIQLVSMSGALQSPEEDDFDPEFSPPRREDTEMGGRSQTSGFESGQLQRRSTFPVQNHNASAIVE